MTRTRRNWLVVPTLHPTIGVVHVACRADSPLATERPKMPRREFVVRREFSTMDDALLHALLLNIERRSEAR